MKDKLIKRAESLVDLVVSDPRWNLRDELLIQVFGFTLYGYLFGLGRLVLTMDVDVIDEVASEQLFKLGIGNQYADGLVRDAFTACSSKNEKDIHFQLVSIGHSYFSSDNLVKCVDSIFNNTDALRNS